MARTGDTQNEQSAPASDDPAPFGLNGGPPLDATDIFQGRYTPVAVAAKNWFGRRVHPRTLRRLAQRAHDPLPIFKIGKLDVLHNEAANEWALRQRQQPIEEPRQGRPAKRDP